jgi:4-aminobutyrate aminotransferase-like enzyme
VPGIMYAHSPYCYRCAMGLTYPACNLRCARDIEELIKTESHGRIAAFIAEPIQSEGGCIVPPKEYFKVAVGIIRDYGAIFICDEVQTGFGRTGTKWFGIEHYDVNPDVMTFANGIGNGVPVGVTIATDEVAEAFTGTSISTCGGNPVSMAAVDATLDVMKREEIPNRAEELGTQLRELLMGLKEKYPYIGDVRGKGLMQAIELVDDRKTKDPAIKKTLALLEETKKRGLLVGRCGVYGNTIRLTPPMLVTRHEIDQAGDALDGALEAVERVH